MLEKGELDFALAEFTVTQTRSTAVDFLPSISEGYQQIFLKNPADALNFHAYLDPYTLNCWVGILIFVVVVLPILSALVFLGNSKH